MAFGRFWEQLSHGERLGEILFGLIMTLTFTLGAGLLVGTAEGASATLLIATIGCNVAWGVIDAALLLLGRVFDRSRLARIGHAIANDPDDDRALGIVADELDETLAPIASPQARTALYRDVLAGIRSRPVGRPLLEGNDGLAAVAVFWSVVVASLPAALPYLVISDPWVALRVSNALLILALFTVGYRWARYTSIPPFVAAASLTVLGIVLVIVAIALGG
jgi:hypothetical protein